MACDHGISSLDWGSSSVTITGRAVTLRIGCKGCGVKITKECSSAGSDDLASYRDLSMRNDLVAVAGD